MITWCRVSLSASSERPVQGVIAHAWQGAALSWTLSCLGPWSWPALHSVYPGAWNLGHRLRTGQTATDDWLLITRVSIFSVTHLSLLCSPLFLLLVCVLLPASSPLCPSPSIQAACDSFFLFLLVILGAALYSIGRGPQLVWRVITQYAQPPPTIIIDEGSTQHISRCSWTFHAYMNITFGFLTSNLCPEYLCDLYDIDLYVSNNF